MTDQAPKPAGAEPGSDTPAPGTAMQGPLDTLRANAAYRFERLAASADRLVAEARDMRQAGQRALQHHPAGWLTGAFALGVLLGALLDRA